MVAFSRLQVDSVFSTYGSDIHILHPWTRSCSLATLDMVWSACRGTYKYFIIIYLLQLCLKGRKANREWLVNHFKGFLKTTLFGSVMSGIFIGSSCFLRAVLGRYYHYTAVCIPGAISAAAIFLERPVRRSLIVYTFFQMTLEYLVRVLEMYGLGPLGVKSETMVFMICNALLLYLLKSNRPASKQTIYWFYTPPHVDDECSRNAKGGTQHFCPHPATCKDYIVKNVLQYAGAGVGIQFLRAFISKMRGLQTHPSKTLMAVVWNKDTFKLGAFLGTYIGVYKSVSCILCRYKKKDSNLYALPAGFLAGAAYYLHPERSFVLSAFTTILQMSLQRAVDNGAIVNIPYLRELAFALCCAILFQARFIDADICPRFIANTFSTMTRGRADYIYRMYEKCAAGHSLSITR